MTDYKITPELAKVLTELVDECWHEQSNRKWSFCKHCKKPIFSDDNSNCTFTTPNDAHKVMEKLVEKGLWNKFYWTVRKITDEGLSMPDNAYTTQWLHLNKERFCCLAGMFIKEREEKG